MNNPVFNRGSDKEGMEVKVKGIWSSDSDGETEAYNMGYSETMLHLRESAWSKQNQS